MFAAAAFGVAAGAADPLGYQRLRAEVGESLADGRGVAVAQVEPPSLVFDQEQREGVRSHVPQHPAAFENVVFHNVAAATPRGSRHATAVARRFYGRKLSMSPGVRDVHLYTANGFLRKLASASSWPSARVWNHSWVGSSGATDARLLRAFDKAALDDDWVVAVGVANGGPNKRLLASAFNILSVGRSDGGHSFGAAATESLYTAQRPRPHLVAPADKTSIASPKVASAAVLLLAALPADSARASVVRAALMAGAARRFERGEAAAVEAQAAYRAERRVQTDNGLDTRFGAGQLNVYNSHEIVTGQRVASIEVQPDASPITASGFDYAAAFGGYGEARRSARYRIEPRGDQTLTAALIWTAPGGRATTIADLDLRLTDITDEPRQLVESVGRHDTGEHVRAQLTQGRVYELLVRVRESSTRSTSYALAWRLGD
ncbi:MAG: hypothetical protein AB8G16_15260 [Gammaproteobacteria bacterium]